MKKIRNILLITLFVLAGCNTSTSKKEEAIEEDPPVMPRFDIDTNNTPITSKEEYVKGMLSISNASEYDASELSLGIRGRGNYSWSGTEKKSYRIKFDKKYQPLGQGRGKAKSWTLLAVHCDKSMLRTDAAFYFANKLSNLAFTSSSSFVELYLNDEYQGVYELCDQMQVNEYRVNIDDSYEDDDNGYLVELDKNASENVITTSEYETYEVKSEINSDTQLQYIEDYFDSTYLAIKNGTQEEIENLIDINSAVDAYLVEEVFKNLDVGWGSFYYYKPRGDKLYFGPVWDFDLCAGNADSDNKDSSFRSYKYTYVGNSYYSSYMQQHTWYKYLRKKSWFNNLVKERFFEIKEDILDTISHIDYMRNTYLSYFEKNFEKWDIFDQKINREPNDIMAIKSFTEQVDFLINWLTKRTDWLEQFYNGEVRDISNK